MGSKRKYVLPSSSAAAEEANIEALDKKPRQLSRPSKVCIICRFTCTDGDNSIIFIVDLKSPVGESDPSVDDGSFTPMDPTLRLFHGSGDVLFVLGSTLYVFEGSASKKRKGGKSVFTYKLPSPNVVSNLNLKKRMLEKAPSMHSFKYHPSATPTPDGTKILVFSSIINPPYAKKTADKCDFELYDPLNRSWLKLPGICDNQTFWINKCAFMDASVVFIQTDIGQFSLDLRLLDCWKKTDSFCGAPISEIPCHAFTFSVIGRSLCLSPFCSTDFRFSRIFNFPEPSSSSFSPHDYFWLTSRALTVLDVDAEQCNFCLAQTKSYKDDKHACLIIDVYNCDLKKYTKEVKGWGSKQDPSMLPGSTIVKSFRFLLKEDDYSDSDALGLFTITD